MKRRQAWIPRLVLLGVLIAPGAWAQAPADRWTFSVTPYVWLPSLDADLRYGPPPAGGGSPKVKLSGEDILDALDFAFMISADARKGRWSIGTDYMYVSLSSDKSGIQSVDFNTGSGPINVANIALNLGTETEFKGSIWTLFGGYSLLHEPRATLDLIAGIRYADLEFTTNWQLGATVTGPPGTAAFARSGSVSQSVGIWDAIVGVRGRFKLGESNWHVPYYLDVGAGDSKFTWQGVAGIAYSFKWGDIGLVYRYLSYEQGSNKLIEDLTLKGTALGATFRF